MQLVNTSSICSIQDCNFIDSLRVEGQSISVPFVVCWTVFYLTFGKSCSRHHISDDTLSFVTMRIPFLMTRYPSWMWERYHFWWRVILRENENCTISDDALSFVNVRTVPLLMTHYPSWLWERYHLWWRVILRECENGTVSGDALSFVAENGTISDDALSFVTVRTVPFLIIRYPSWLCERYHFWWRVILRDYENGN
jgi:hypothetical protein